MGPHGGRKRCMHMHGPVKLAEGCLAAVGVDSSQQVHLSDNYLCQMNDQCDGADELHSDNLR